MTKIRYDTSLMKFISVFESLTRARVKDCFENRNGIINFIVEPGQMGRALGRNASNVRRIEGILKKRIKVIEFNPDLRIFIRNLTYPLGVKDVVQLDSDVIITGADVKTKGLLIGRNLQNLLETESIVKRYFKITKVKVV